MIVLRCRACAHALTGPLVMIPSDRESTNEEPGKAYVPAGVCLRSDGKFFTHSEGKLVVAASYADRFLRHPEASRSVGCCGPSGSLDRPNLVCYCGREVATLFADCWLPHAILIDADAVDQVAEGKAGRGRAT